MHEEWLGRGNSLIINGSLEFESD